MKGGVWIAVAVVVVLIVGVFLVLNSSKSETDNPPANIPEEETPIQEIPQNPNDEEINSPITHSIEIKGFNFQPEELNIKTGDTVTWTNGDSVKHTVTSDSGSELDSELLSKGETYSHTFTKTGTYDYHCAPHPYMTGKIVVE